MGDMTDKLDFTKVSAVADKIKDYEQKIKLSESNEKRMNYITGLLNNTLSMGAEDSIMRYMFNELVVMPAALLGSTYKYLDATCESIMALSMESVSKAMLTEENLQENSPFNKGDAEISKIANNIYTYFRTTCNMLFQPKVGFVINLNLDKPINAELYRQNTPINPFFTKQTELAIQLKEVCEKNNVKTYGEAYKAAHSIIVQCSYEPFICG
jgi:hypothetical protein